MKVGSAFEALPAYAGSASIRGRLRWPVALLVKLCQHPDMAHLRWGLVAALGILACASGPHPAIPIAAKAFPCDEKALTLHKMYPRMVRVEGCGKEVTYVEVCDGYGMDSKCRWARKGD